jgi:predicted DCC family thiol-disulfide oxidoreductase YuxK
MEEKAIVYFDGVCNLCDASVRWIIRNDKKNHFRFAALQSEAGKSFLLKNNLLQTQLTTFFLFENNILYCRSDAAVQIAKSLGWKYSWLNFFKIIPRQIRDVVYNWVAKNRYRWFGKQDECLLPIEKIKEKFL